MPNPFEQLKEGIQQAIGQLYDQQVKREDIIVQVTKKEFEGDLTVVVFPFTRFAKKSPEETAKEIGEKLKELQPELVSGFSVVKGFLNLSIRDEFWKENLKEVLEVRGFGKHDRSGKKVVLEYCGPNTNKPLHLGHIRNLVIGYSMANILEAHGDDVHKVNIYNDRGIAICKSMIAWLKTAEGETPESSGIKGDHLVGKYYVKFAELHAEQVDKLVSDGMDKEQAKREAPIQQEAQVLLRKWEAADPEAVELWKRMNNWVYEGFELTYDRLGVDFEKHYYESETYLKGREMVLDGLEKNIFVKKEDGSVWADLTGEGLDEKLLLRSDGTSVYLTQDIGTAEARYEDYTMDQSIYTVANEQEYHFKALQYTLKKLGKPYWEGIYHLSYGMVDLPTGKMKSREGTTVDADDLYQKMLDIAEDNSQQLGKLEGMGEEDKQQLYRQLGLGALKYFLLRVNAKKRILFDPQASIEFQGDTGPFVQYTHARICSVLRKWEAAGQPQGEFNSELNEGERDLLIQINRYGDVIKEAAESYDPSQVANYVFGLAKQYNKFYHESPILQGDDHGLIYFRIQLSRMTARVIASGMNLLGIEVPEQM